MNGITRVAKVAREAHNLSEEGANPSPATISREEAVANYNQAPNVCENCNLPIPVREKEQVTKVRRKRFCTKECADAASRKEYKCSVCEAVISHKWTTNKYCSECFTKTPYYADWSKISLDDLFKKKPTHQVHARVRALARDAFNRSKRVKRCEVCGYDKFVEVCHRKSIATFTRDTFISVVNDIGNLMALCPNCHWEHDNT